MRLAVGMQNEATRDAWVRQTLQGLPRGGRILDAGAGEQKYRKYCSHLEYVAQDFAKYDPSGSASALQMDEWNYGNLDIVSDVIDIPVADESFDTILCTEVLEHIANPVLAIKEFSRIIKPDGRLILTAPFCSLTHFSPYHFSTGFSRFFYETHLPANGFKLIAVEPNGNYFEYLGQELHRLPGVAERYAKSGGGIFQRIATRVLLMSLARLTKMDCGSSELLCFGFHVVAVKNKSAA